MFKLLVFIGITLLSSFARAQVIDPKNIASVKLESDTEQLMKVQCGFYGPVQDTFAIDYPRSILTVAPCQETKDEYLKLALTDKEIRKQLIKYAFGEQRTYERNSSLEIILINGESIAKHTLELRMEVQIDIADQEIHPLYSYDNDAANAKNALDVIIQNKDKVYFNQYGLCFRILAEVTGLNITSVKENVDCSSVPRESLISADDF